MNNVIPIRPAAAPQLDPHNVAVGRLWQHRDRPRAEALSDCIGHLCQAHDMPEHAAENAAIQALAELDTLNVRDTIDIATTTSHAVVFTNAAGQRIALTARDLRELLKGHDLQAGNAGSGRLLLLERPAH
ncbi:MULTISPECIES: hypothetical protein [Halomonas]|uniref:Uncharacterized protein n=1 Tax=Halomonas halophila TaxID=29573 RepID=A0ABQ0U720_9GAMM|nr:MULTISPECIES: hypothetical protein [Halomonas]MDR5891130.1 hypothetical protein [Halomonas salina]WJY08406.1 hypothetical protein QWG60_05695 [Halomonas halophila]GEK74207.1 hypothetical protein HHA04nite_27510 [Halomonas halophila]